MGLPTMSLPPMTTARRRLMAMPFRSSSSMMREGVPGGRAGRVLHQPADVDGVEPVDVVGGTGGVEDPLLGRRSRCPTAAGDGMSTPSTSVGRVQPRHDHHHLVEARIGVQALEIGADAKRLAGPDLVAHAKTQTRRRRPRAGCPALGAAPSPRRNARCAASGTRESAPPPPCRRAVSPPPFRCSPSSRRPPQPLPRPACRRTHVSRRGRLAGPAPPTAHA